MTSLTRRRFLTTTGTAAGVVLAGPHFLRGVSAQGSGPLKIGFPLPLTGPFARLAADQKRGGELAMDELNGARRGAGAQGRGPLPRRRAQAGHRRSAHQGAPSRARASSSSWADFAAHVQMAINEQTKKAGKLFISISQSDEISAKPDTSPHPFHEALNPTITGRVVGSWALQNLGKKYWIVYADYAWGKQNNAVFTDVITKGGGTVLGNTPYPLGKPEFSAHLPKIQAAKPEVLLGAVAGRGSGWPSSSRWASFGMKKEMKLLDAAALPLPHQGGRGRRVLGRLCRHQLLLGAGQQQRQRQEVRGRLDEEVRRAARRLRRLRL